MARLEIFAGRERRRFWSEEQKRAILAEAAASGSTMTAVAVATISCRNRFMLGGGS